MELRDFCALEAEDQHVIVVFAAVDRDLAAAVACACLWELAVAHPRGRYVAGGTCPVRTNLWRAASPDSGRRWQKRDKQRTLSRPALSKRPAFAGLLKWS